MSAPSIRFARSHRQVLLAHSQANPIMSEAFLKRKVLPVMPSIFVLLLLRKHLNHPYKVI